MSDNVKPPEGGNLPVIQFAEHAAALARADEATRGFAKAKDVIEIMKTLIGQTNATLAEREVDLIYAKNEIAALRQQVAAMQAAGVR